MIWVYLSTHEIASSSVATSSHIEILTSSRVKTSKTFLWKSLNHILITFASNAWSSHYARDHCKNIVYKTIKYKVFSINRNLYFIFQKFILNLKNAFEKVDEHSKTINELFNFIFLMRLSKKTRSLTSFWRDSILTWLNSFLMTHSKSFNLNALWSKNWITTSNI